jgi:hypothetical protein
MTPEELKKQEADKAARAAQKSFYVSMAAYHEREVLRFKKQADDVDPVELDSAGSSGDFAGL